MTDPPPGTTANPGVANGGVAHHRLILSHHTDHTNHLKKIIILVSGGHVGFEHDTQFSKGMFLMLPHTNTKKEVAYFPKISSSQGGLFVQERVTKKSQTGESLMLI